MTRAKLLSIGFHPETGNFVRDQGRRKFLTEEYPPYFEIKIPAVLRFQIEQI